jgi:hypothetical protein
VLASNSVRDIALRFLREKLTALGREIRSPEFLGAVQAYAVRRQAEAAGEAREADPAARSELGVLSWVSTGSHLTSFRSRTKIA